MYIALANLVALLHLAFIGIFLWSIVISLQGQLHKHPFLRFVFWLWFSGKILSYIILNACIFTMTEQYLRSLGGHSYSEGFIVHYLNLIGIQPSDLAVIIMVVTPMVVGIASEFYWYGRRQRDIF